MVRKKSAGMVGKLRTMRLILKKRLARPATPLQGSSRYKASTSNEGSQNYNFSLALPRCCSTQSCLEDWKILRRISCSSGDDDLDMQGDIHLE